MSIAQRLAEAAETLGKEGSHQRALFAWAATKATKELYPELAWLFAIPNGGERPKPVAMAMVAEGARTGVPDIFLPVKRAGKAGLFIELKRPAKGTKRAGKTNKAQDDWLVYLRSAGYGAAVCVGWEAARNVLIMYLESENNG